MTTIPDYQLTPPAGHHDALAFRPACSQLMSRWVEGQTEWFVTLPDGADYVVATTKPQPTTTAYAALDASGICKTGGVDVPIVAPNDAHTVVTTRPIVNNQPMDQPSPPIGAIALGGLAIVAISIWAIQQRQPDPQFRQLMGGK